MAAMAYLRDLGRKRIAAIKRGAILMQRLFRRFVQVTASPTTGGASGSARVGGRSARVCSEEGGVGDSLCGRGAILASSSKLVLSLLKYMDVWRVCNTYK